MKRSLMFAAVTMSVCVLASPAMARQKKNNQNENSDNSQSSQSFSGKRWGLGLGSGDGNLGSVSNIVSQFKKKKDKHETSEPKPIDPPRGDDRVPVEPVVPQGRPGFVFVDGHWEREKAPTKVTTTVVDPMVVGPVVRDHRTPKIPPLSNGNGAGGVTVTSGVGPIVRDHRTPKIPPLSTGNGAGGVTVTTTPGSTRGQAITGSGPNPFEVIVEGLATAGNKVGIGYGSIEQGTPNPNVRDHR